MTNSEKVIYDYVWLKIVQTTSLASKPGPKPGWKIEAKQYHINANGKNIADIQQSNIPDIVQAIEHVISSAKTQGVQEYKASQPKPKHVVADKITDELPRF